MADNIQMIKRRIMSEFLTEIGVNNANTDKRERLTDDEVQANDAEIQLNSSYWLDEMQSGFDRANALYNLNIKIRVKNVYNTESEDIKIFNSGRSAT